MEEHLRTSPASRRYFDEITALDLQLQNAFGELEASATTPTTPEWASLESRIQDRFRVALLTQPVPPVPLLHRPPLHRIERYRSVARSLRVAAALILLAIGAPRSYSCCFPGANQRLLPNPSNRFAPGLPSSSTANDRLARQNRNLARTSRTGPVSPFRPDPAPLPVPGSGEEASAQQPPSTGPSRSKTEVFRSIQSLLEAFQKTGKWDAAQERGIVRELAAMGKLSHADFVNLRHWFEQQEQDTYGQEFLAQVISRFCTHDQLAREFICGQVENELNRMASEKGFLGDRYLRRAWTAGLISVEDARNTRLLYNLGQYELDETNRGQIYNGLSQMGTADAAYKLADLALRELNGILKSDSLEYLYDMLYNDPSISDGLDPAFFQILQEIIQGNFGTNGEYTDAMLWALRILAELNFPTDGLQQEWQNRNGREKGGDRRSGNPRGHPLGDRTGGG